MASVLNTVTSVLEALTGETVSIYTQDYSPVLIDAHAMKVIPKPTSKIPQHPVETGSTVSDHVIIDPVELDINFVFLAPQYRNLYDELTNFIMNHTLLIIQARSKTFNNMLLREMVHEESATAFNSLNVLLKFKEFLFANTLVTQNGTTAIAPKNPTDSTTVDRGVQQPQPVQKSVAVDLGQQAFDYFHPKGS